MVNPLVIVYSTQTLSEVSSAACLILFFIIAEKIVASERPNKLVFAGLLSTFSVGLFFREVGIALMLSATVFFLSRKEYQRAFLVLLIPVVFYLLWLVRNEIIAAGVENPDNDNSWQKVSTCKKRNVHGCGRTKLAEFVILCDSHHSRSIFLPCTPIQC